MKRLPLWGRMLGSLLIGHEADIVRGDLEEAYLRRTRNRASSYLADLLKTLFIWWSPASIWRRKRKTPSTGGTMGFGTFEDLRHVCRNLIRRPGFALTVLVTLGLGIGATTTIYSVVDAVVVRPLPYPNADRLVVMGNTTPGKEWRDDASGLHRLIRMSGPNAMDWKLRSRSFEKFALVEAGPIVMMNSGVAEVVQHAAVGSGFFELFPVKPFVGRVFSEDDYAGRNGPVQMLSYGAWVRKHGADPKVIGTKIIGVLPPEYTQPESLGRDEIEFWSALDPNSRRYSPRDRATLILFGRLSRGVTLDSARKELTSIQDAVSSEFPAGNVLQDGSHRGAGINYLHADIVGASSKTLWIFLAASSFLLLIAVLNAANLLLVRGLDREHDVSVRQALGASPTRLVRSQLTESLVLALVSGGLGVLLAYAGVEAFLRIGPASLPRLGAIAVNWRILAATITVSLGVGVVVGLIPALRLTKRDVALALLSHQKAAVQ